MTKKEVKNGTQIYGIEGKHFGEYFLLTPQKDLQFWNKTRSYYTAKKIKLLKKRSVQATQKMDLSLHALLKKNDNDLKESKRKKTIKFKASLTYYTLNGKTYFTGKTNLPEKTKIGIQLNDKASDFKIFIKSDGSYTSTGFSNLGKALIGEYKVDLFVYRNKFWQTKDVLKKLRTYYGHGIDKKDGPGTITKKYTFNSKKERNLLAKQYDNMNPFKIIKAEKDSEKNLRNNIVSIPNMSNNDMIDNCKVGCSIMFPSGIDYKNCVYSCTH